MRRIMLAVLVAYVLAALSLVGQGQALSDSTLTLSAEQAERLRIMIAVPSGSLTIVGTDPPKTTVVIHSDGRVEYSDSLPASAKAFWEAVEAMGYTRECKPGEKVKK